MNVTTSISKAEAQEEKPETTAQNFARVQRAIVKVLFNFYGFSPKLDDRLKRLRGVLKTAPRSASALTLIDESVEQLVATNLKGANHSAIAQAFADFLSQLQVPSASSAEVRSLQRRFSDAQSAEDLERLTREASTLVNRALREPELTGDHVGEGAEGAESLARLLTSIKAPEGLKRTLDGIAARVERARARSACLSAAAEAADALSLALAGEQVPSSTDSILAARNALSRLLNVLEAGDVCNQEITSIYARLDAAHSDAELSACARSAGELIKRRHESMERELAELGAFLRSTARRVEEFRTTLQVSGNSHQASIENASRMQAAMHDRVTHLKERVIDEAHIDALKGYVTDELIMLEDVLAQHVSADSQIHQSAAGNVSDALTRLSELELEVMRLRNDLDEQHSLNLIDPLTGILNRLGYNESVAREYARWRNDGGNLSLAMLDIDFFKQINDRFGHATGDKVLTSLASLLRKHLRGVDHICRVGGEEFVLVMPDTDLAGAATVAEKMRATVAASQFRFKDTPVPVTFSCGVATFRAGDIVQDVFERADGALYAAKNSGRNRCATELELSDESQAAAG